MNLRELSQKIGLIQVDTAIGNRDKEVLGCYIGDLLSNVMAHAKEGDLWLTVQTHRNVVAVAVLLNLAAIVFVEGHLPQADTVERAHVEGVPLFSWPGSAYQLARELARADIGSEKP